MSAHTIYPKGPQRSQSKRNARRVAEKRAQKPDASAGERLGFVYQCAEALHTEVHTFLAVTEAPQSAARAELLLKLGQFMGALASLQVEIPPSAASDGAT
jgi:hypothetical protein